MSSAGMLLESILLMVVSGSKGLSFSRRGSTERVELR